MSDERAFLRAILARPTDAALRLIYADWLEERGDPRGEYIRLQAQVKGTPADDPTAAALQKRMRDLATKLDPRWLTLIDGILQLRQLDETSVERSLRPRQRRDRRERLEADVGLFLRQYARKTKNTPDPNDRHYSRAVEEKVKRMKPEALDRLLRGED